LGQAVKAIQASAFGCAGEGCMAGSIAVPVGSIGDPLVDGLCEAGRGMKVGPTDDAGSVDMGPVISAQHRDKVASYLDVATKEGAEGALDGRKLDLPADGFLLGPGAVGRVNPAMGVGKGGGFRPA